MNVEQEARELWEQMMEIHYRYQRSNEKSNTAKWNRSRDEGTAALTIALQRRDDELARAVEDRDDYGERYFALKAQHEAALREVSEWQRDFTALSKACGGILGAEKTKRELAEAHREIERLGPLSMADAYRERIQDFEAQVRALREALDEAHSQFGQHSGHWDKRGGSGSGCPVCIRQHEVREKHKSLLECASCHKNLTDDPAIALVRKAVKGIRGVLLCQWCEAPTPPAPEDAK